MSLSIRKYTAQSNLLPFILGAIGISAFLGTLTYHLVGWPHARWFGFALLSISSFITLNLLPNEIKTPSQEKKSWFFNAGLFLFVVLGFYVAFTHRAITAACASLWQCSNIKFEVLALLIFGLFAYGFFYKKINDALFFITSFFLISLNTLFFPLGYGFDIFIHHATIAAWLTHGSITPLTPLYNGFDAVIASFAQITTLQPITIISWIVPLIASTLLLATIFRARAHTEHAEKIPAIIVGFFILFNPLFTTQTPQALGHLLFFGLIMELWLAPKKISTRTWVLHVLTVIGIGSIHPLSGIPAVALLAWMCVKKPFPRAALSALLIASPATLLILFSHDTISFAQLSFAHVSALFIPTISAFQPFVLTRLAYIAAAIAPLLIFIFALSALRNKSPARDLFLFSLVLILSAFATLPIQLTNVIGYEQTAFTSRLLLAAYLCMIPLAAIGFEKLIAQIENKKTKIIVTFSAVVIATATWYTIYPAWNSISHTKAQNVSERDFQIINSIDADASGAPYIVLADQTTSAAALARFGFFDRQLPNHDFYFYPIPTGGELYTKFFLPAMYGNLDRGLLIHAGEFAGVRRVYIVLKPEWQLDPNNQIPALQSATENSWKLPDGTYIGNISIPYLGN
ncbi:MAG: hypothetical protein NT003_01275 [Candidatus Magasanikbacteria bacterium]|nr:hypothetical protein [Candidatus Magasanikbacteria bacterium]